MATWLCSDWHFNHDREFVWSARGFSSVQEMNQEIIARHNSLVAPEDDVYVLGDCALGGQDPTGTDCIKLMNGKLHIALGNHDTDSRMKLYAQLPNVIEIAQAYRIKYLKYHFYLSHYPTLTGNLEKESLSQMTLNIFGHTHQTDNFYEDRPYMYHCGVDSHNCYPVNIDDIIKEMKEKVCELSKE